MANSTKSHLLCPPGGEVSFHDGAGWNYLATTEPGYHAIGPFTENRVALWHIETWSNDDPCSLATIERDTGEFACERTLSEASVVDVFGVDDGLAYYADEQAVHRVESGRPPERVFEVSGRGLLWASEDTVVHATVDGPTVTLFDGERVTTLPPAPVGTVRDVWATDSGDIWLGGTVQLRHWDGSEWAVVSTASLDACEDGRILYLWGEDDVVYAGGYDSLGRIDAGTYTPLVSWCEDETAAYGPEPTELRGLWGWAGGDELLLLLRPMQEGVRGRRCMDHVLVLYDGTSYRRI